MPNTPTLRRPPLAEEICERLLTRHRRAEWLPPERTLALQLGVSRSALREAIKQLEIQGLLEVQHGVGVRVTNNPQAPVRAVLLRELPDSAARIRQFAEVRILVEPAIARSAAERATRADLARLAAIHARMGDIRDFAAAVAADLEFHHCLAEIADNRVLALMLSSIAEVEEEARRVTLEAVGLAAAYAQHQRIFEAVSAHDGDAAHAAMLAHVEAAESAVHPPASKGRERSR